MLSGELIIINYVLNLVLGDLTTDRDTQIWEFLSQSKCFVRNKEIKKSFPRLHDAQLSKSLGRLEKQGLLVKNVAAHKNVEYLAINPSDSNMRVRIMEIKQLYAVIEMTDDHNITHIFGTDLGELSNYIHSMNGKLYLKWPKWITGLAEAGKVSFNE